MPAELWKNRLVELKEKAQAVISPTGKGSYVLCCESSIIHYETSSTEQSVTHEK